MNIISGTVRDKRNTCHNKDFLYVGIQKNYTLHLLELMCQVNLLM